MASPTVAAPPVNGAAALSRPDSPASTNSSIKRKRDASDDGDADVERHEISKPAINGVHKSPGQKPLIHDFFDVLQSYDTGATSLLKRPLPESFSDGEPLAKRTKSEDDNKPTTIADKITQDAYHILDDLFSDVAQAVKAQIKELEATVSEANPTANDEAIANVIAFRTKAFDLYRRELAYPNLPRPLKPGLLREPLPPSACGGVVLTTVAPAPQLKPLFSSLQRASSPDGVVRSIGESTLPNYVVTTQILPESVVTGEKNTRTPTLGELFPSPRNLPPLQPPKAPKNTTKSNSLTFYHPELTEKSKYRTGTYFSQNISAGHWLDYSNATPTMHAKTRQRERAQSLAGHKPSSTELEMSEMEALFRGAFSTFAPSRDDSAAIIPSRQVSRIWWQRVGRRNFEKLTDMDASEDDTGDTAAADSSAAVEFDEEKVKSIIENWDESAIDPALSDTSSMDGVFAKKSDEEKDTDDLLEEVSDMIETLASYQRNRNLTLPTSQDRYSADPVNGDMLRNGNLSHQPTEEEAEAYKILKTQLKLIVNTLPPYAVARLNSDRLAELNVSTRIEIRTDEYKGVMEEDEPARLARQAAQAAASSSQRQHRVSSVPAASPYPNQLPQYPGHFTPSARPIAQQYPQTPVRPQVPNVYQRPPSTVPLPQQHQSHQRPQPPPTQYRPQQNSFGGYAPQLAKAQTPYGHSNMVPYAASPTQPRMPQQPNYNMGPAPTQNQRYPPNYPGGYQQPHQQIHPQHVQHPPHLQHAQHSPHPQHTPHHAPITQQVQQHPQQHAPQHMQQHVQHAQHPQQQGYSPYANGGQMPRTMSPQVPPQLGYGQSPTPPQQHHQMARPYPSPGMPPNPVQQRPVMPEVQQRQVMEQARARADAEQRVSGHMGKVQGEVVGLAGIGLGGTYDVHKIAAAKAMQMGNSGMSPSPKMSMHGGPSPVNGGPQPSPSPLMAQHGQHGMPSPMQGQIHHRQSPVPLPVQVQHHQHAQLQQQQQQQQQHGVPSPLMAQAQMQGFKPQA
ncbi:hypothetical protein B0T25DRAFT_287432 [Lasiosphaeria hispida]|uniref:Uncharacterized protein n=1 Tax=Lasiosphaeria hispida TaxID=260671 RepID=A0AAJ0MAY5_9PEZI|nr:hypothetical protein B0T25DRAFT_287432 [Lasiosphaeria hispida]